MRKNNYIPRVGKAVAWFVAGVVAAVPLYSFATSWSDTSGIASGQKVSSAVLKGNLDFLRDGSRVWSGRDSGAANFAPGGNGPVAHFTLTPPANGFVRVIATYNVAVRNKFDSTVADCRVGSSLSTSGGAFNSAAGALGAQNLYVAGNLPTTKGGTYQWFPGSLVATYPVTEGAAANFYLNGGYNISGTGCFEAIWYDVNFSAEFVANAGSITVVAN